jgi:hypothetical protein
LTLIALTGVKRMLRGYAGETPLFFAALAAGWLRWAFQ